MKKKIIITSLIGLALIGTLLFSKLSSDNDKNKFVYSISTYITKDMKEKLIEGATPMASFEHEYTPQYLKEITNDIAIIKVISLDKADTKYNQLVGFTYGKLLVNTTISGNLKSGDVIDYMKPGGVMSLAEWEKTQPAGANEKNEELRKKSGVDASKIYYNFLLEGDIILKEGKTYLAYLAYNNTAQKYEIIGLGEGLREVNIPQTENISLEKLDLNTLEIKNNKNDKLESLKSFIDKNITQTK